MNKTSPSSKLRPGHRLSQECGSQNTEQLVEFAYWVSWGFFSSVHSLNRVQLFATPWTAARQASLSITDSWSLLKLMFIESVMPSNHLILCRPILFPPSVLPSIRVFSNESTFPMSWPKYWSFSFSISPSNEHPGLISFMGAVKETQVKLLGVRMRNCRV